MNSYISVRFFRTALLGAFVAVGLLMTGCDSSGSNGGPDWVGDWEAVDDNVVWSITEDRIQIWTAFSVQGTTTCEKTKVDVTNVDGNEVTGEDEDGEEETVTFKVQDDGQLEATFEDGDTQIFNSLDENPEDALGCDVISNN